MGIGPKWPLGMALVGCEIALEELIGGSIQEPPGKTHPRIFPDGRIRRSEELLQLPDDDSRTLAGRRPFSDIVQIIGTLNRARKIDIFGDAADRRLQLTLGTSRDVIVGERQNGETGKELRRFLFEHMTGLGRAQRGIRGDRRRSAHAQPPDDHLDNSTADTD
ncbi:MAG: hypothetical protein E8D43_05485 [Nitrospira sp.]|nr:MAG: hypothetical protein E8D43_05485 [Nitrospira sp.]